MNRKMNGIAKEIITMKLTNRDTFKTIYNRFYKIMRKYGIKQGTESKNGNSVLRNNYEWTMCWTLLKSNIDSKVTLDSIFLDVPKNLQY